MMKIGSYEFDATNVLAQSDGRFVILTLENGSTVKLDLGNNNIAEAIVEIIREKSVFSDGPSLSFLQPEVNHG